MTDPVLAAVLKTLGAWYAVQRANIPFCDRPGMMLGGVVWGPWYLDLLARYCLPTLLAPENAAALQDCCFSLYTAESDEAELHRIMEPARKAGIAVEIMTMPHEVVTAADRPFLTLAAAQQLLVIRASRARMAFHQLMPDHGYSSRCMPNLRRVGAEHRNVAQGGINTSAPAHLGGLETYRADNGSLVVPARELTTMAWDATIMCAMNDRTPDAMPDEHYQVWRARDRVMLFNACANPAYIVPEVGQLMDSPDMTTGTLDCQTRGLFGRDFYVPTIHDDMVFVAMGNAAAQGPAANYQSMPEFLDRMWREIAGQPALLGWLGRPTEMAATVDKSAPTAVEVTKRQHALVTQAFKRAQAVAA